MCVLSVSLAVMQQSAAEKERGRSGQFGKRKLHHFPSFSWTGGNRSYPLRRVASPSSQVNSVEIHFTHMEIFVRVQITLVLASFVNAFTRWRSHTMHTDKQHCVFDSVQNHLYSIHQPLIVCTTF